MQNADVVLIHSSLHDYPLATNLHQANPSSLSGSHQDAGFGHQIRLHTGSLPQVGYTTATWLGANHLPSEERQDPGVTPGLQLTAAYRQAQGVYQVSEG